MPTALTLQNHSTSGHCHVLLSRVGEHVSQFHPDGSCSLLFSPPSRPQSGPKNVEKREEVINGCLSQILGMVAKSLGNRAKTNIPGPYCPTLTTCASATSPQVSPSPSLQPFLTLGGHRLGEGQQGKTKKGKGLKCNDSSSFGLP